MKGDNIVDDTMI